MIIKECYIENFGTLSQVKKTFVGGLNVFVSENGWGKTTFSVFLRTMLYGMEGKRAKDSVREKYRPWQGGKYGGYIIFTCRGKTYRAERYFYSKESEDTFSLYDCETGQKSSDFGSNLGVELFLSDKETFAKTAYIPQGRAEVLFDQSGSIISAMSEDGKDSDDINYDKAASAIEKAMSFYERRTGGHIRDLEQEYAFEEERIYQIKKEIPIRAEEEKHLDELTKKLAEIKNKIKLYHNMQNELMRQKNAEAIREDIINTQEAISLKKAEVKKIPDKNDLQELSFLTESYRNLSAAAEAKRLTENETELYVSLKGTYKKASPEDKKRIYELISLLDAPEHQEKKSPAIPYLLLAFIIAAISIALTVKTVFASGGIVVAAALAVLGTYRITENKKLENAKNKYDILYKELLSFSEHYMGKPVEVKDAFSKFSEYFENEKKLELLDEKSCAFENARNTALSAYDDLEKCAEAFTDKAPCKAFEYLQRISYELSGLEERLEKSKARLIEYSDIELNTETAYTLPPVNIEELEEEEGTVSLDILETEKRLEVLNEKISALSFLTEGLNRTKEKLSEARAKHKILKETANCLKAAKERIDKKYVKDIKKSFSEYASELSAPSGAELDNGFSVNVEKQGAIRQSKDFSIGERDVLGLALRFSVLDAVFKNEGPPVILDDPLVNLDEEKLKKAKAFIASLSEKYQIIYFTCDKNRGEF